MIIDINKCAYCGERPNTLDYIYGLANQKNILKVFKI